MSKKVYVFLADGFEEVEALTPVDVFRRANINAVVVSTKEILEVTGAHNIKVIADGIFEDYNYDDADLLLLPGGMPGTLNLKAHNGLREIINKQSKNNKWIGAICAAPSILGANNILEGLNATCYPGFEDQLLNANVTSDNVVTSGKIITGRGVGVAMQFSLEIVKYLIDEETALALKQKMVIP